MIEVFEGLALPEDVATQAVGIVARRGGGTSYTALRLVEGLVGAQLPVVVLDPLGVCFGLRSNAAGDGPGLPVTILGGDRGDLPLEPTGGAAVAQFVVDHPGAYVLDLSGFEASRPQDRFAGDFAEALYRAKGRDRTPLHLVVDEADSFAPQKPFPDQKRMLGAFESIVRRGRARGLGCTMITQRPAVLNKNVLTQIEVLVALQVTSPQDRKALSDWAEGWSTKPEREAFLASLAHLDVGEAWVWSPQWLQTFQQVRVTVRSTFDSSSTPKAGERRTDPVALAPVDLDALKSAMAESIERQRADDPRVLRAERDEARAEAKRLRGATPDPERVEVEVPVLSDEVLADIAFIREHLGQLVNVAHLLDDSVGPAIERLQMEAGRLVEKVSAPAKAKLPRARPADRSAEAPTSPSPGPRLRAVPERPDSGGDDSYRPRAGARRMLEALAPYPAGLTAAQVATIAGMKRTGGTWSTYASELVRHGLIAVAGSTTSGRMALTEAGAELVGAESLPVHDPAALRDSWRDRLKARGAREMFDHVVSIYPQWCSRSALAAETSLAETGGTFSTYLSRLRSNDLIEEDGTLIRANPDLF